MSQAVPRVVITGLGIVSSIGNGLAHVVESLSRNCSGMVFWPEMKALGYRCCVYAPVPERGLERVPRRLVPMLSKAGRYALAAGLEAVGEARLTPADLAAGSSGVVVGTGVSGRAPEPQFRPRAAVAALAMLDSTPAAMLARHLRVGGRTESISAACATGLYNIGHAFELLRWGRLEVCLCGSAEGDGWAVSGLSADNSQGMPYDWNDRPTQACRPYDRDRQGFVASAGAGILVLETLAHARRRGARILAEVVGYGAANDGADMFLPSGEGLRLAIDQALAQAAELGVSEIDYINTHGTGTGPNDRVEAEVLRRRLGDRPMVSSTKGLAGHSQGATSAQEAVFTALMLDRGFVAPTVNLDHVAPDCTGIRHVRQLEQRPLAAAMKITSGLGGVNACLVLRKDPGD